MVASMRTRSFGIFALAVLTLGVLFSSSATRADEKKIWKVGILWHAADLTEETAMFGPFAEGMRELGYVEGQKLILEHTFVDEKYELFPARAEELLNRKVDVILASVPAAAAAAGKITKTIPIVFAASGDPVK